jgi:hypothetical protein
MARELDHVITFDESTLNGFLKIIQFFTFQICASWGTSMEPTNLAP